MGIASADWEKCKDINNIWSMDYGVANSLPVYTVAQYPRFKRVIDYHPTSKVNMVWNSANGVWEWELEGWNWPWEDESEAADGGPDYGTGVRRSDASGASSHGCAHEWVNISFNNVQLACKYCGIDKPEQGQGG